MKVKYTTTTHSEQSCLLQEAKRMVPCSKCCTGYVCTFPCKKGARGFLLPIFSFLDGLTSALPVLATSGLKEEPQLQPQSGSWTKLTSRCLTPDQANRKGRPKGDVLTALTPPFSLPPHLHHARAIICLQFGCPTLGPNLHSRRQKPVTYCLGFRVSLQMVT